MKDPFSPPLFKVDEVVVIFKHFLNWKS